uniref:NADH:ubiquinone reductase (H(+)-translocating) n=1 Tax=Blackfordia virginica TaxID=47071 RepID=A0A7U0QCI3_9CNID|nr:NADH dehydrogenase subunit 2 [Blackfordia virginica]QQW46708.1 NADH dehydrogenase subunit 2 [Blackfordia virginica]
MKLTLINIIIFINFILTLLEFKNNNKNFIYLICSFSILGFLLVVNSYFNSFMFDLDYWKCFFLVLVSILYLIIVNLIEEKTFDIYLLCLLAYLGSGLIILSDNLISLYLGLELQTFSIFILIAKNRASIKSAEAGLKYFILGAISSGFYLLGVAILFLSGFSLELKEIIILSYEYINLVSIIFISLSFCFKLSLFPLHFWIPDIYEGTSWDIISLISTLPKISVICLAIQLIINTNLFLIFSVFSIIIGTLGALNQTKIKRLLAYSGISHIGFILLGYSILTKESYIIGNLYLFVYMIIMISIFILIINNNFKNKFIIELSGLKFVNKIYAITLCLLILSVAGIPPLSGFISKWFLLWVSLEFNYNIASFIIVLFSAIGAGYYLRLVKIIYFQKKSSYFLWQDVLKHKKEKNDLNLIILGFLFFICLFLILNFSFIIDFINISIINLF